MYLVTSDEMRRFEADADAAGLSYDEMMRRAGSAVAEEVEAAMDSGRVLILAGPGNNGGDALVAAALLHDSGYTIAVHAWKRVLEDDPLVSALVEREVPLNRVTRRADLEPLKEALLGSDAVVDGLLGTGVSRPIEGLLAELLDTLREAQDQQELFLVAVDVPTGLNVDTGTVDAHTVPSDLTVTFGFPKVGQFTFPGADYLGELVIDDIGLPEFADHAELNMTLDDEVVAMLPVRPRRSHKGTFGRALVVAGSANYTGAAYLAGAAAYRSGAGLVTLALPGSIHQAVASLLPEATFVLLPEDLGVIARPAAELVMERWDEYDAVLIGPGLTAERPTAEFISALITGEGTGRHAEPAPIGFYRSPEESETEAASTTARPRRVVVDADGLNLLAGMPEAMGKLPESTVLTPHPGEMARLTGQEITEIAEDRIGAARKAATQWGHVVVLKGAFTVIASPEGRADVIPFADSALATAGSGDVLAGLVVGFLAQGMEPYEAAVAAAYVHGLAGDKAGGEYGARATMAGSILDATIDALLDLEPPW